MHICQHPLGILHTLVYYVCCFTNVCTTYHILCGTLTHIFVSLYSKVTQIVFAHRAIFNILLYVGLCVHLWPMPWWYNFFHVTSTFSHMYFLKMVVWEEVFWQFHPIILTSGPSILILWKHIFIILLWTFDPLTSFNLTYDPSDLWSFHINENTYSTRSCLRLDIDIGLLLRMCLGTSEV